MAQEEAQRIKRQIEADSAIIDDLISVDLKALNEFDLLLTPEILGPVFAIFIVLFCYGFCMAVCI
jgi:hypothetical protein